MLAADTVGCKSVKMFATPGWRISRNRDSRQYDYTLCLSHTLLTGVESFVEAWSIQGESLTTPTNRAIQRFARPFRSPW